MRCTCVLPLLLLQLLMISSLLQPALGQLDADEAESDGAGGSAAESESSVQKFKVGTLFFNKAETYSRKNISIPYSPGTNVQLRCHVTPPGVFLGWVQGFTVVGDQPVTSLTLKDDSYGKYLCIAANPSDPNKYFATEFLLHEMPSANDKVQQIKVPLRVAPRLTCSGSSSSLKYTWYRYDDAKYRFVNMNLTGESIIIPYQNLTRKHDEGFTYYKCVLPGLPSSSVAKYFRLNKEPLIDNADGTPKNRYEVSMRPVDADIAAVPVNVIPNSRVSFECHKQSPSESVEWAFRPEMNSSYGGIDSGIDVTDREDASVLSVKECGVKNVGYFKCNIGDTVRYAFLRMAVIVPSIHDYSKTVYNMTKMPGDSNELECEIPIGGNVNDVVWRVIPTTGKGDSFDIRVNQQSNGFAVSNLASTSNRLVVIRFKDNKQLNGYRLECRLGDELDYTTLAYTQNKSIPISIRIGRYEADPTNPLMESLRTLTCEYNELSDIKFHELSSQTDSTDGTVNAPNTLKPDAKLLVYANKPQKWFKCSGLNKAGVRVYSDILPMFKTPTSLQILVDGVVTGPSKPIARVANQPTTFTCKLTQNPDSNSTNAAKVLLLRNGIVMPQAANKKNDTHYEFTLQKPTPGDSGNYSCKNDVSDDRYKVTSPSVTVNWCKTDQFMCDGGCKNSSVKCNKVKDCKDGTDELPTLCNECEPHSVPCGTWNGKKPMRKCTLKHWLCDGTDDCGNNYDEESKVAKSWCTKTCTSSSLRCATNETCCLDGSKCYLRGYECDSERDCPTGSDESNCKNKDNNKCNLRVLQPNSTMSVRKPEGSFVKLTCSAEGMDRPTINWRCNWGHLRDPKRMTEANEVVSRRPDGTYSVIGTLTITNFTKSDECLYNCEVTNKCGRRLSPPTDLRVGEGQKCDNTTCGVGGNCVANSCVCKKNVYGDKCDRCKSGFHSLSAGNPDGCSSCFCSNRFSDCSNAGLYYTKVAITPKKTEIRMTGWGLYGNYEASSSEDKVSVKSSGEISVAPLPNAELPVRDDDESYVFITSFSGDRLTSYGGKIQFTFTANVRADAALSPAQQRFPLFGIKGWRGRSLFYWNRDRSLSPQSTVSVELNERNLRAADGSAVTRDDVMTALSDLHAVLIRANLFDYQQGMRIRDMSIEVANASTGDSPAPIEKCNSCAAPYLGNFCQECSTKDGDYHKIIDYNNTVSRWKCVPCKVGYTNAASCNKCEPGYADPVVNRNSAENIQCDPYAIPTVEPETLQTVRGRTLVLTCTLAKQRPGYNGTAWLLYWTKLNGDKIDDSSRVFQVRTEKVTRLVIKDVQLKDAGRYRCEAFNRNSGSAFAFTNVTVINSPVKMVMLKAKPSSDAGRTDIECVTTVAEPARSQQFRAILTHAAFTPQGGRSQFASLVSIADNGSFTGKLSFTMNNTQHSGFWSCHVTDLLTNFTVSRRIPVILNPDENFNWDLQTPSNLLQPEVGDAVRLKCSKRINSKNAVTIPVEWQFTPENPSGFLGNTMAGKMRKSYSIMNDTDSDLLPHGAYRDGDDVVLNPVSGNHWGEFRCMRRRDSTSGRIVKRSISEEEADFVEQMLKPQKIKVNPKLTVTRNINTEPTANISLAYTNANGFLDIDGLPCQRFSWWYRSGKTAQQLVGRNVNLKLIQITTSYGAVLNLTNVLHTQSGMYYCQCFTYYRFGFYQRFSKISEFNVFISATEDRIPSPNIIKKTDNFVQNATQWLHCSDKVAIPKSKISWTLNGKDILQVPGIRIVAEQSSDGFSFSNITFQMNYRDHQGIFMCIAQNSLDSVKRPINFFYLNKNEYNELSLEFTLYSKYGLYVHNKSDSNGQTDVVYVSHDQFGASGMKYLDFVSIICQSKGTPSPYEMKIEHDNDRPTADVMNKFHACKGLIKMKNLGACQNRKFNEYARYKWKCIAKHKNPITNEEHSYEKNLHFKIVQTKIFIQFYYYKQYGFDDRDHFFRMVEGSSAVIRCDAKYKQGDNFTDFPFEVEYLWKLNGTSGLPRYAEQTRGILKITNTPKSLNYKMFICFVVPKNRSLIAVHGVGQRVFRVQTYPALDSPKIIVETQHPSDPSLNIRSPGTLTFSKADPMQKFKLSCSIQNFDETIEQKTLVMNILPIAWGVCKNCDCNITEVKFEYKSHYSLQRLPQTRSLNQTTLTLPPTSPASSGCFVCVSKRYFVNYFNQDDALIDSMKVKIFVESKPGKEDYSYQRHVISEFSIGSDVKVECNATGYPAPSLKILRYSRDDHLLADPAWQLQYRGSWFSEEFSSWYGTRLTYLLPNGKSTLYNFRYECIAKNSLGESKATTDD